LFIMDRREYLPVPVFDYSSAFNYQNCILNDFDEFEDGQYDNRKSYDFFQLLIYYFLTFLSYLFFIATIPISSFFCVKKVNSLQRCMVHRLGNRLPLKGPGYILKLPFIDHVSIINLLEEQFNIEVDGEILTGDGSIITARPCIASLNVTNAVATTLKIGKIDVKQCLKLRFSNVLRSKHVEDLENKMDFVVKQFEENCNKFLQRWGYTLKIEQLPRITVIERADPINPIKSRLKQLLNPDEADNPKSAGEALLRMLGPMTPSTSPATSNTQMKSETETHIEPSQLSESEVKQTIPVMEWFIDQYKTYIRRYKQLSIQLIIDDDNSIDRRRRQYMLYNGSTIECLSIKPSHVDLTVRFISYRNYEQFIVTKDVQFVQYSFS
ncbi:hypothetical protein BLOT_004100, partial [Blomia tropicalis]